VHVAHQLLPVLGGSALLVEGAQSFVTERKVLFAFLDPRRQLRVERSC
jgi:hypothetical protein